MWCTRWFLPLLLLPLPTASPYFLIVFLFSLTLHARPCFYCIILLTALFVSSCYWQSLPSSNSLTVPWSENITTFADALNASLSKPDIPRPSVVHILDRCWCDFSSGNIFEPFNVSQWEKLSVESMKEELERLNKEEEEDEGAVPDSADSEIAEEDDSSTRDVNPEAASIPRSTSPAFNSQHFNVMQSWLLTSNLFTRILKLGSPDDPPSTAEPSLQAEPLPVSTVIDSFVPTAPSPTPHERLPLLRREYDLRRYGLDIIIDFGWSAVN